MEGWVIWVLIISFHRINRMQRFLTDTTEELTQRNLKSPRAPPTLQAELIQQLQRENLYLKNQLFALIHNSGVYDMYLPSQELLCQRYIKNGRNLSSPHQWTPRQDGSSSANESHFAEGLARRQCFSPRVQSNCARPLNQLTRAKSPQLVADIHKRMGSPGDFFRKASDLNASPPIYGTIKSQNHSPSRITPKESSIFTTQPSQGRLNTRDMNSCQQARDKINQLKRNAKSPSFLKNRQAFKENVRQSLSNIMKEFQNHYQRYEQSEDENRKHFQGQINNNAQTRNPQNNDAAEGRSDSKSITVRSSEGDSCLSIERRLREILYEPNVRP